MANELTFWPATITGCDWKGERINVSYLHDVSFTDQLRLRSEGFELSEGTEGRILVGVDLTRPEREFTVGPYIITLER